MASQAIWRQDLEPLNNKDLLDFFQENGQGLGLEPEDLAFFEKLDLNGLAFYCLTFDKLLSFGAAPGVALRLDMIVEGFTKGREPVRKEWEGELIASRLKKSKVMQHPPPSLAQPSTYESIQRNAGERILDDRPVEDNVPPIPLLYAGYGEFLDIVAHRRETPNFSIEDTAKMEEAVDKFAKSMCEFFKNEDARKEKGLEMLNSIFATRNDNIPKLIPASIGSARTDGHYAGPQGVATLITEFKNRPTGNNAIPEIELVGYFVRSFVKGAEQEDWGEISGQCRLPGLGITIVGSDIKFFAVLILGTKVRLVNLTPSLSCIPSASGGHDRELLYRAFKAALVFQTRVRDEIGKLLVEDFREITFPKVSNLPTRSGDGTLLEFQIQRRWSKDSQRSRLLYLATTSNKDTILIKFVRQYSVELHEICAALDHAPALLAFGYLPGGWFGVGMEYVADALPINAHNESVIVQYLDEWEGAMKTLVKEFHDKGLVHGDLRDANIISTSDGRLLLVDFDWGGQDGIASYPTPRLNNELTRGRTSDTLTITKTDDLRILDATFDKLKNQFPQRRTKSKRKAATEAGHEAKKRIKGG